jgi:hypothetical protein
MMTAMTIERTSKLPCVGWLILAMALMASPLSAQAQSGTGQQPALHIASPSAQPETALSPLFVRTVARLEQTEDERPVIRIQGAMGSMPMAMVMPGNTLFEMSAGACAAGILVGALAAVTLPVYTGTIVATNAAIGCGVGIAATVAATLGMSAARAVAN